MEIQGGSAENAKNLERSLERRDLDISDTEVEGLK